MRAIILSIAAAIVLSGAADAQPPATAATASVRGRIIAADTGKPLRRARVAFNGPALGGQPRTVNTNADGRYEIKDLPEGRYQITVTRSGYLQLRYGQRRPLESVKPLQVLDGQTVEQIDFALPRTGSITGVLTDEIGDIVANANVYAMRSQFWQGRRQFVPAGPVARSDDSGLFRIGGLAPGSYIVRADINETWTATVAGRKEVMTFAPTYAPGVAELGSARAIDVGIAEQVAGVNFRMMPGRTARISGRAMNSHGQALTNVSLVMNTLGPNGGSTGIRGNAPVLADGSFTIANAPPGNYTLIAAGGGEVVRVPLTIASADIDNISVTGSSGWSASGRIMTEDGGVPTLQRERIRINANDPRASLGMRIQGEPAYEQAVNDDWTFSVSGIVGPALMRLTLPAGWGVKAIVHDGQDVTDAALEMKSGEAMRDVQIILTNHLTLVTGQLLDGKGLPIDGTIVLFASDANKWIDDSRYIRSARPDQQGKYQIEGLPPGDYLGAAIDYVPDGSWNDPEYLESIRRLRS